MIFNQQEIGGTIAKARKRKNLTQLELADYLNVSYQAVSNWERGQSMPDIDRLADLATVLALSLDDLLKRPNAKQEIADLQDSTAAVTEDTLTDFAPLIKPQMLDSKVKDTLPNLEHLEELAPFVEEDTLFELVQKQLPKNQFKLLTAFAPFLSREHLESFIDGKSLEDTALHFEDFQELLPFLGRDAVDTLLTNLKASQLLTAEELSELLPFASADVLSSLLENFPLDLAFLEEAAPFLKKEQLKRLIDHLFNTGEIIPNFFDLDVLFPFLDKETNDELLKKAYTEGAVKTEDLGSLLPFVSQEALWTLAKKQPVDIEFVKEAAPFLGKAYSTQLLQLLLEEE